MNKKEITIKRKRTGILFFIFIWSLLEIMVGACFVYMLIYMPSIFLILTLLFFLSGPAILIMIFVEELNKEVKICDGKIFIKYDRKKHSIVLIFVNMRVVNELLVILEGMLLLYVLIKSILSE